ncbi:MAG: peptide chain release factor N(5)-glutamine methyltransferase [Planctomycetes bacterium]|nr:peptide chain release factor N(5)-glutamine methyltransferase [Planctomycetota bacterium]
MMPRLMDLVQRSAAWLAEKGLGNARREAEWIFGEALGLTRMELFLQFDRPLTEDEVARLRALVARRGRREPLAYVLGSQDFRGLRLRVSPAVLVPRPETEELVERVLAELPAAARVLDVGTGSGAIALALRQARADATVLAVDLSPEALAVARANAEALGLAVDFRQGDLAAGIDGPFAAVVANLPYIAESERPQCDPETAFEPAQALFAGADGLDCIRRLVADARRLLAPGGLLWLEHGWRQAGAVADLAAAQGLDCSAFTDAGGHPRFARLAARA